MSAADSLSIAWISRGRLFVKKTGEQIREIESDFAKQSLQREMRENQQNAWKGRSGVWGNLGMQPPGMAPWETTDPRRQIRFVLVARGASPEEIFYVLDMGAVGGLFSYNLTTDIEKRLVHRQGFVLQHLSRHPVDGDLAMSLPREDGTSGLKITRPDGLFGKDIALSDSIDESPQWHPDGSRRLVFQSSAIGRNEQGYAIGQSPYRVEVLDLDSEQLKVIHEEEHCDLLQPRIEADGSLLFIKRPYKAAMGNAQVSLLDVLKDIVLFPYRLLRTFVYFFNFLSMMFSGKPLISAGGPERSQRPANPYLMLWGQAVDTQRILSQDRKGMRKPLVPNDWQLIRRNVAGQETLVASNVLAWDVGQNGQLCYTDGRSIYYVESDGKPLKLADSDLVEKIAVLG